MGTNLEIFSFFSSLLSFKGKMISALSLCLIVLIPAMQSDSAMGGFSGMMADEKPTANGGGQSDTVKDVSSEAEARRVSVLKELGLQHRNKAPLRGGSNAGASSDSLITPLSIAAATAASAASIAASASMVALAVASPAPVIDSETVYSLGDASVTLQPTSKSAKIATKKNGKAPPSPGKTSSSHEKRTNKTKGENANANATDSSNGKNANHLHDTIKNCVCVEPTVTEAAEATRAVRRK